MNKSHFERLQFGISASIPIVLSLLVGQVFAANIGTLILQIRYNGTVDSQRGFSIFYYDLLPE